MAPVLGIYANLPLVSAGSGKAAPAVFLIALILTLPTAISYALIAREVPSAGSAYTWLSEAVNARVGLWTGLLLLATYFFAVVLQPILFGQASPQKDPSRNITYSDAPPVLMERASAGIKPGLLGYPVISRTA